MTDRELLKLAANATGHKWKWVRCPAYGNTEVPGMHLYEGAHEVDYWPGWNPLADDGDALRLAVRLNLTLRMYSGSTCAQSAAPGTPSVYIDATNPADHYAATRLAIVKAAAEIGKSK